VITTGSYLHHVEVANKDPASGSIEADKQELTDNQNISKCVAYNAYDSKYLSN